MLKRFDFRFGRGPGQPKESMDVKPLTVFVGPNNSGKSLVLREIQQFLNGGHVNTAHNILHQIEFEPIPDIFIEKEIARITLRPHRSEVVTEGHMIVGSLSNRRLVSKEQLEQLLREPGQRASEFCQWFMQKNMLFLDGTSRINLIVEQPAGNLQAPPTTSFQALFQDHKKRAHVRDILFDAFGEYFVLDPTNLGTLKIRMSLIVPERVELERGIDDAAVEFHQNAEPIEIKSDGVKAFTRIISQIIAGDPNVILIDEPEAFLHPSLSFQLGKQISLATQGTRKKIFASTHSASFVRGCIQSGAPVNIVRLTYRNNVPTARILEHNDLITLMRDPLLRSAGAIEGLFSEFVVVCEADSDRAFYEEINERLALAGDSRVIPSCLFLNAQNKQTVPNIVKPLRELGIPAVGIVDLDVLKEGGQVWTKQLAAAGIPEAEHQGLAVLRANILKKLNAADEKWERNKGIQILKNKDREAAQNLIDSLSRYGLFLVPNGEQESWLRHLGANGHGPAWLIEIFQKMGSNPEKEDYVWPSDGDVWEFLGKIRNWMLAPDRKGIPS